jgi:hypothetical protein
MLVVRSITIHGGDMREELDAALCISGGWIRTLCDKHEEKHQRGEYDEIPSTVP